MFAKEMGHPGHCWLSSPGLFDYPMAWEVQENPGWETNKWFLKLYHLLGPDGHRDGGTKARNACGGDNSFKWTG